MILFDVCIYVSLLTVFLLSFLFSVQNANSYTQTRSHLAYYCSYIDCTRDDTLRYTVLSAKVVCARFYAHHTLFRKASICALCSRALKILQNARERKKEAEIAENDTR